MGQPRRPLLRLAWSDPESDATGFVVVDRLVTGIATGGLRTRAGCTMEEVEDLAREMSLKTGVYRLPVGGAKGGIDYPADAPDVDEVRRRFVTAMRPLLDTVWVTAGDLGTPQARLDSVFAEAGLGPSSLRAALLRSTEPDAAVTRVQRLFAEGDHGLRMPDLIGGYGVAEASLAGLAGLGLATNESRAVVQGFGAMGGSSALYLHLAGVRVVGVSDAFGLILNTARGLDIPKLLAARSPGGIVDRAVLRADDEQRPGESWLDVDAELLVPAAVSYSITETNCDSVRAQLVTEAANVPITKAAERRLLERDVVVIPDFVANAGAAAWAWWAIFGLVSDPESSRFLLSSHVRPLVNSLINAWITQGVSPRDGAENIAEENLDDLGERFGRVTEMVPLFEAGLQSAARVLLPDDRQRPTTTIT